MPAAATSAQALRRYSHKKAVLGEPVFIIVPLPLHERRGLFQGFFQRMYNPVSIFSLEQSQINLTHSCTTIYITVEHLQKLP